MAGNTKLERMSEEQRQSVVNEYLAGSSCEELARKYAYSASQIGSYIRLKIPSDQYRGAFKSAITDAQAVVAIDMMKSGVKPQRIADSLNISIGSLHRAIKRYHKENRKNPKNPHALSSHQLETAAKERQRLPAETLSIGSPLVVNAMWRGLERWRGVSA